MNTSKAISLALVVLAISAPLHAGDAQPRESYCAWIKQTPEGKFTTEMKMDWSLLAAESDSAGMALPENVVGITCLRDPPILVHGDLALLKQGRSLYFGVQDLGMTMVKYELKAGKIVYRVDVGGLNSKNRKKVEKAIAALQARM